jgi:DNA-binding CsgD family transcriptional regulator
MRTTPDNPLQELIGQLYEAAFDDARWSLLPPAIATAFRADSARLESVPLAPGSPLLDSATGDGQVVAPFSIFCWQRELWERRRGGASSQCDDDCADWCHRPEVHFVLGATFPVATKELGKLHIHRHLGHSNYEAGERNRVAALLPHLRRAMQLRKRIAHAQLVEQASASVLEGAMLAAFVVDAELTLLHANPHARALLDQGDVLRLAQGRVVPQHGAPLARLVRAAADGAARQRQEPARWLRIERGHGRAPLALSVAPLPAEPGAATPQPLVLMLLRDPKQRTPPVQALQQLFDLTPAEASVAQALAGGDSLDQVAQALLISPNTVKTHLHRIFDKTATSRQGELIALIHGSIAAHGISNNELKNNNVIHLNDAAD